jgi:glycosyltransferase involved in cell wall biosynthesis
MFPAYNDGGTIPSMVLTAILTARELTDDFEVIVVNDGSSDYTAEVLDELARVYAPVVRIIHHPKNRGYGGALRSGFAAATKEWIFYTDGDAQYDPHELKLLVAAMTDGVDMVNGYKIERNDPLHRIVVGHLYRFGVKRLFGLKLRDVDCDFRLMRRRIFDTVQLQANTGVICVELMSKVQYAGFGLAEAPVHHFHRAYGKSQFFNWQRVLRTLAALARLWWQIRLPLLRGQHSEVQAKIRGAQANLVER